MNGSNHGHNLTAIGAVTAKKIPNWLWLPEKPTVSSFNGSPILSKIGSRWKYCIPVHTHCKMINAKITHMTTFRCLRVNLLIAYTAKHAMVICTKNIIDRGYCCTTHTAENRLYSRNNDNGLLNFQRAIDTPVIPAQKNPRYCRYHTSTLATGNVPDKGIRKIETRINQNMLFLGWGRERVRYTAPP